MKALLLAALAAFSAGGCKSPMPPVAHSIPFDEAAYAGKPVTGTGVIKGQAFVRTIGGDVKYAAGLEILLRPRTAYMDEWHDRVVVRGENLEPSDVRAKAHDITVIGDGSGGFTFDRVPAGDYYVASYVFWMVPSANGLQQTGGWACAAVTIADAETKTVVVTH